MRLLIFWFALGLMFTGARAQSVPAAADSAKAKVAPLPGTNAYVPEYGGTATVLRRDNTDVYIMSKPLRPYEVVGRITNDIVPVETDPVSGLVILRSPTIVELIDGLLARGRRRQQLYDFPYDAVLTYDGQTGTFVRWRNRKPSQAATPSELRTEKP